MAGDRLKELFQTHVDRQHPKWPIRKSLKMEFGFQLVFIIWLSGNPALSIYFDQ